MRRRVARTVAAHACAGFLALALALTLAGCTVNPATGRRSFTLLMPPAEEARVGARMHPEVSKEFGGPTADRALAGYVDRVGQSLARHSEIPGRRFTFTVLDSDIVNAFALPGGYVYVTRALVALAGSEAELAGVLAHEIGHVTARHTAERYSQAAVAQILLGVGSRVLGGGVIGDVMQVGAAAYLKGFSREQEYESDLLGVRYLLRSGYEPRAMSSFLAKLQAESRLRATLMGQSGKADNFNIMSTHPRTADRVQRALAAARATETGPAQAQVQAGAPAGGPPRLGIPRLGAPRLGIDDHMRQIDGLFVDGDPRNGFIKGSRFVHPADRFQFTAPPGFRLFRSGENTVLGQGPGDAVLRLDWIEPRRRLAMTDYIAGVWARNYRVEALEPLTVGGLPAATGVLHGRSGKGRVDMRLVAIRSGPGSIHRLIFLTPAAMTQRLSLPLRRATHSFRRLSPAAAARERPYRLRVFRAGPGDTAERLAARMPYDSHRMLRFRVLNGLAPGEPVRPGRWIKLVGD